MRSVRSAFRLLLSNGSFVRVEEMVSISIEHALYLLFLVKGDAFHFFLFWELTHACIVSGLLATFHRQHVRIRSVQPVRCSPTQPSQ